MTATMTVTTTMNEHRAPQSLSRAGRLVAAVLLLVVAFPLHADFRSVARAIEAHHGVKRVWIPFLGVARVAVWVVHPKGVHDFQLVTFQGADELDASELRSILREKAGQGFTPLVEAWSRRSHEWTFIYARPDPNGRRVELMVLTHDSDDTVLVRVDVDADVMARELDEPRNVARLASQ